MEREKILHDVNEALKYVLCRQLESPNKEYLENAVNTFVDVELKKYSDEDLEERFLKPNGKEGLENAVNLFREYLEQIREDLKKQFESKTGDKK